MKDKSTLFTIIIFWIGFGSFLATSIPHVAWLYQSYEPANAQGVQWFYTTVTSYGVAIGIDVMIAWLSFICARGKVMDWGITVLFIALLSALSQYANFLYAMAYDPVHQSDVWNIGLLGGLTTTGYLTPIVISAVPFFSLAYTFMLSRIDRSKIDLEGLAAHLENRKRAKAIRDKYRDTDKESLEDKAKGAVTSVIGVVRHAVKEVSGEQSIDSQTVVQSTCDEEVKEVSEVPLEEDSNMPQTGSPSLRYVPLVKAGEILQYDLSTVKRMVTQKKLKTAPKSDQLVTMASINALLAKKQPAPKRAVNEVLSSIGRDTDEIVIPETKSDQSLAQIVEWCEQELVHA